MIPKVRNVSADEAERAKKVLSDGTKAKTHEDTGVTWYGSIPQPGEPGPNDPVADPTKTHLGTTGFLECHPDFDSAIATAQPLYDAFAKSRGGIYFAVQHGDDKSVLADWRASGTAPGPDPCAKVKSELLDCQTKSAGYLAQLKAVTAEFDAYKAANPDPGPSGGGTARTA